MSNAALAFFTGLGEGYVDGKEKNEKKARQAMLDQRDQEEHNARMAERRKQQTIDATVAQAARPMVAASAGMAKADWADNRDVGAPDGATLANGGLAPAATANTAAGTRGRVVAALQGMGEIERADRLEQSGRQGEATEMQLQQAKETMTREKAFRSAITRLKQGGWAGLPKLYEDYNDGNTVDVQEDGKGGATLIFKGADGKALHQQHFANQLAFATEALANLDPKLYIEKLEGQQKTAADQSHRTAVLDETKRHNQATEKTQGDLAAARIEVATARAEAARAKAAAEGKPVSITAKELEDASKTIRSAMDTIYQPKEGMDQTERDKLGLQRDKAASEAHGIYRLNNTSGQVIDTGTAIYAARVAADPKNLLQRAADDGKTYPGVVVNGQFVMVGPALVPKKPAAQAPTQPPKVAASMGIPNNLGAVLGARDTSQRVTAADLLPAHLRNPAGR